jgi:hypothetical protein
MSNTENLESVLALASKGWKLFPQHSGTKHPTIRKGWNTKATDETKQLTEWFTASPDANVGVKTGKVSNLMVLDVDGETGKESLRTLEEKYGAFPATLQSMTGRGQHLFFNHPGHKVTIKHSTTASHKILGQGLEIKADGEADAVTVPPSIHANGKTYQWVNMETPVANAPNWLLDLLTLEDVPTPAGDVIPEGQRNDAMYAEVCNLFKTCEPKDVLPSALEINQNRCKPPLSEAEVRGIVERVSKSHKPAHAREKSRSSRNPLHWFPYDVSVYFGDQDAQTLSDYQLGWRHRLMAFAWQSRGYLRNDRDALFTLSRATSKPKFQREMLVALYDFEEVIEGGKSCLLNRGMAQEYADKMAGWTQKREAGQARAKAKADAARQQSEPLPMEERKAAA